MRVRHWVLVGSASVVVVGMLAGGCGGSSDSSPGTDAGNDISTADQAADQSVQDTGSDVTDAAAVCKSDADLDTLSPPDASLFDGGSSVGVCLGCVHGSCESELKACNADCDCKTALIGVVGCVLGGSPPLQCAGPLLGLTGNSQALGVAFAQCIGGSCAAQCTPPTPPRDGAADGPADAANDG